MAPRRCPQSEFSAAASSISRPRSIKSGNSVAIFSQSRLSCSSNSVGIFLVVAMVHRAAFLPPPRGVFSRVAGSARHFVGRDGDDCYLVQILIDAEQSAPVSGLAPTTGAPRRTAHVNQVGVRYDFLKVQMLLFFRDLS